MTGFGVICRDFLIGAGRFWEAELVSLCQLESSPDPALRERLGVGVFCEIRKGPVA
jgi:hypothetical protein